MRFGEFEADLVAGELRRGDVRVRLSRQPVELLTALLERPGQVVTRDELRTRLWREDTFVDFDHGLNAAVNRLREALGDSAQAPRFVETLPGRGYRFVQAVEVVPEAARAARGRAHAAPWIVVGLLVLAAAVLSIRLQPRGPVDEPVRFAVTLPAGVSLDAAPVGTAIALSPDGRQVAFVANSAGRLTQLWLRRLDALSAQPLAGTEGAVSPFWSPDGRSLAFFSEGKLRKIPAEGGPPETLCDAEFAMAGTWNHEDTILFSQFAGARAGLWRTTAAGGAPSRVQTSAGQVEVWPQFLPDGRHFLFLTGRYPRKEQSFLHVASLDDPTAVQLMPTDSKVAYVAGGRLVFVRRGSLMSVPFDAGARRLGGEAAPFGGPVSFLKATASAQFSASADGRALVYMAPPPAIQLVWLDRLGRLLEEIGDPAGLSGLRLSPDGTKVASHIADVQKGTRDIWVDDLARGLRSRLTTDQSDALFPVWDPTGARIAYSSARRGPPQLYVRGTQASDEDRLLLDVPGVRFARDWSPDGRHIVLELFRPEARVRHQLWLLALEPPGSLTPFAHGDANKYHPRFSPDGLHIAFTSEETGRPEVVVASLDGTSYRQVSSDGGFLPRWRGDGRELFYLSPLGELVSVGVTPGRRLALGDRRTLFALRVTPSVGMTQAAPFYGPDYDVTADGQRFLFNQGAESAQTSFVVLFGWQGSLGR